MKKIKNKTIIFVCTFIVISITVVLAVFYKKTMMKTNISILNMNINAADFTVSMPVAPTFQNPGDKFEITLNLNNNVSTNSNGVPLEYYFGIEIGSVPTGLEKTLLVSYNGVFLGTLEGLCNSGNSTYIEYKIKQEDIAFILPNEQNLQNKLTIELHNSAPYYTAKTANIKVNLYTKSIDVQKYIFVKDAEQFSQAVTEINGNQGQPNRTIVLADNLNLNNNYDLMKPCTIDLLGKNFNFSTYNINIKSSGLTTIKSTRQFTPSSGGGGIVLNTDVGWLDVLPTAKAMSDKVTVTACLKSQTMELVSQRIKNQTQNGVSEASLDILAGLNFYFSNQLKAVTILSEYTYNAGIITPVKTQKTLSTSITVEEATPGMPLIPAKKVEFKIIGAEEAVLEEVLTTDLAHLVDGSIISYDLFLPTKLKNRKATVEWWSSNQELITSNGKCVAKTNDKVILVATLKINDLVYTKEYSFTISKMNNSKRFQYLLDKIGNIMLDKVGPTYTQDLPTLENYMTKYAVQDLGITSLTCSVDSRFYYITKTGDKVYLNQLTFEQYAQVNIEVKFGVETMLYSGVINVDIVKGSADSTDKVYEYVRSEIAKVDVWQNIVNSRIKLGVNAENGDFILPTTHLGLSIAYDFNSDSHNPAICTVDNNTGKISVNLLSLQPNEEEIKITVSVDGGKGQNMTFTVPAAIHQNTGGASDLLAFTSARNQVYAANTFSSVTYKDYIFINDIKKCTVLAFNATTGDLTKPVGWLDYFTELTSFSATQTNAAQTLSHLAKLTKLTDLTLKNASLTDITAICKLPNLVYLDVSQNASLNNVNPILSLNLKKLAVFDASGTDATMQSWSYYNPLYDYCYYTYKTANSNVLPTYYYSGSKQLYVQPQASLDADYIKAMKYCYSLKEISEKKCADKYDVYLPLPPRAAIGTDAYMDVTWDFVNSNITSAAINAAVKIPRAKIATFNDGIISASLTVNGKIFTRYFYIDVIKQF